MKPEEVDAAASQLLARLRALRCDRCGEDFDGPINAPELASTVLLLGRLYGLPALCDTCAEAVWGPVEEA